ncbi:TlpA family protein disulfide reductase [Brevibacillus dissolubilis]|uniref:TlpA family protein disulfide reductase n=1 Tax=Brevibacillus dissolubilis TaxID=1844116 RepID=UPI00159BA882|nr:TlpA disulfide reductase family protein [Brevibacillus dissolubilis]
MKQGLWMALIVICTSLFFASVGSMIDDLASAEPEGIVEHLEKYNHQKTRYDFPHIGYYAPDLELPNRKGDLVSLDPVEDPQPTLIMFWTSWSDQSKEQIEKLTRLMGERGDGVRVLFVNSTNSDQEEEARSMMAKLGVKQSVLFDRTGDASHDYSIKVYPTFLLVGADGKIKDRWHESLDDKEWKQKLSEA